MRTRTVCVITAALLGTCALQALADPPAHAPAHGWRKKHDPHYVGYTGTSWERDYEVSAGRCNREEIGAVLGAVAGGAIGSKVGSDGNRTVAILIGAAVGALIGAKIGRELDEGDRGCFGHALEIGRAGQRIVWDNPVTHVSYALTPGEGRRGSDGVCRDFTLLATRGKERSQHTGRACQSSVGVWKIVPRS